MQENPRIEIIKRHMSIKSRRTVRRARKYLLTGVLVTAPIAITLYLAWVFLVFMDHQVAKIIPGFEPSLPGEHSFPGLGLIVTIAFFIAVGWMATNIFGQMLVDLSEYIMSRVPILRTLYNAIKQIVETLMGSQAKAFREVVMIQYPRAGTWTLGFVTGIPEGEIKDNTGQDLVTVFVPTAPSPVNGFLLFVPRQDIIPLQMSVDEGIKMVVSVGILTPPPRTKEPESV